MGADLNQGRPGNSRAIFLVRQGESKVEAEFLPNIPPMTVSGYPTIKYMCR